MTYKISRCIICGKSFDSKKQLKHHKDRNHRIINSKIAEVVISNAAVTPKENYYDWQ
jgi:predicted nucleic acid-binding protein